MYIIGITGGTGSGKTVALRALEDIVTFTLDCDAIYHGLLRENDMMKAEIEENFHGVLVNNEINRTKLGEIVFQDESALLKLNAITHKYVAREIKRRLAFWEKQDRIVVALDAIALIESGVFLLCDILIGIIAPVETRVTRIMQRDRITREQALQRINAQKPDLFYIDNCDYVLENTYETTEEFEKKCKDWFTEALAQKKI